MNQQTKKFDKITFEITLDQLRIASPRIYERLRGEGASEAKIMVIHTDSNGNINVESLEAIAEYKPDAIFTCHPKQSRAAHTDLPVIGWSEKECWINYSHESRVVRFLQT